MFKIAVCDDDEKICNLLENYINDSCRILHIEAETESFISGKVLKRKLREGENYQIYFLDIEIILPSLIQGMGKIKKCAFAV